jgi:hypothetical protein
LSYFFVISAKAATNTEREDLFKLSPPHAELPPSFWEQYGNAAVLAAILVVALVGAALWLLLRPKPSIQLPVEILARNELEALRQRSENGQVLSQVSRAVRRYVTGAFGLPPDELTTTEFCRVIAGQKRFGPELAERFGDFLRQCDEIKFSPNSSHTPIGAAARALELVELGEARRAYLRSLETAAVSKQPAARG